MKVGVIGMPGRKEYAGQSIKPRFFILGLPLFPTSCYYKVSDNLGFDVPLTKKDIFHGFAKIHLGVIGVGGIMAINSSSIFPSGVEILLMAICGILVVISGYSWLKHSKVEKEELTQRRIFGEAFLYNMTPEDLPIPLQKSLFAELIKVYHGKYGHLNWQQEILDEQVTKKKFSLLYTLAYYQKTLDASAQNLQLFSEIGAYLRKEKKVKPENDATTPSNSSSARERFGVSDNGNIPVESELSNTAASFASITPPPINNKTVSEPDRITSSDLIKLHEAKESLSKQLLMLAGVFIAVFFLLVVFMPDKSNLIMIFLMCIAIFVVISGLVFFPDYQKLNSDISNRRKIKATIRIRDMAREGDTTYLIPKHNIYGIKKVVAPAALYSTNLLNKDLEIYVGKESHTLLEILQANY